MKPEFDLKYQRSRKQYIEVMYVSLKLQDGKKLIITRILSLLFSLAIIFGCFYTSIHASADDMQILLGQFSSIYYSLIVFVCIVSIAAVLFFTRPKAMAVKLANKAIRLSKNPFYANHYSFFEDHFVGETDGCKSEYSYNLITDLIETQDCILIFLGKMAGHVIDKDYFTPSGLEKFQRFLISKSNIKFDRM